MKQGTVKFGMWHQGIVFIYEARHSRGWHVTPGGGGIPSQLCQRLTVWLWALSAEPWFLCLQDEANKTHFLVGYGWMKLNDVFRVSVVQWVLIKGSYSQPKVTLGRYGERRGHEKSCWQSVGLLPPRCDNLPDCVQSLGGPAKQDCSHDLYSNTILQETQPDLPTKFSFHL